MPILETTQPRRKVECGACQRFALAAGCHADRLTKRTMFFERKKALKRHVATRQPASIVGTLLTFTAFAKLFEKNLRQPTKLAAKAGLNKTCAEEQNKKAYQILQLFERKKLIVANSLAIPD